MVVDGVVEKFDIKNVSNMFLLMQHSTLKKSSGESEVGGSSNSNFLFVKKKHFRMFVEVCLLAIVQV